MKELLNVERLCVAHRKTKQRLVHDLCFSLSPGHSLTVLGQSGCGKTMTCHSIMGLLDARRFQVTGCIAFEGRDLLSMGPRERRGLRGGAMAMIPQNPMTAFDPSARIGSQMRETLALHSALHAAALEERVGQALEQAGLSDVDRVCRSYPHTLSGGMLQRVMIAMALMVNARLIVADEPTTALDVVHRNATVEAFAALRERGTAVLLVTHDFSVAAQLGGSLLVMRDGVLIEGGMVEHLLNAPRQPYTRALLDAYRLSRCAPHGKEAAVC